MKIQTLLSTMHQEDISFLNKMNIKNDVVIINQTDKDEIIEYEGEHQILFISNKKRGLSNSRNDAIKNSNAEICLLADDDMKYFDDTNQKILDAYKNNPCCDVIVFNIKGLIGKKNNESNRTYKIGYLGSLKISSVQITFRRKSIINNNINFNNHFGAGSQFYCGEENIFLFDCLNKGLKIIKVNVIIGENIPTTSTWFNGYNKRYFESRGAVSYALFGKFFILDMLQFLIRKYSLYKKEISFIYAFKCMLHGLMNYKKVIYYERSFN